MQLRLFRILWGPTLETVLDFVWPVAGDAPRSWRQLRDGADRVIAATATDVSVTGRDYVMAVTAKWFSLPYLTGGTGLQAFIDWANAGNSFTLMPDTSLPTLTVPGCFLDAPFADPSWSTEDDGSQTVDLIIRHPTRDLGLAWRGLFFEYVAGQSLTDPVAYTQTRASIAYEIGPDGYLHQLASGVLADGHYPSPLAVGLQTTIIHQAVTNDIPNPEDLTNATWTKSGDVTIAANKAPAPDQAVTADQLVEGVGVTQFHAVIAPSVSITAGDTITAIGFVRSSGRYRGLFRVTDAGNANGVGVNYDLSAGTLTSAALGTGTLIASKITPMAGGWSMIWFRGTIDAATTTAYILKLFTQDASGNNSYTGDGSSGVYFWGATVTHGALTTTGAVTYVPTTRAVDQFNAPFAPTPQAAWMYVKFVEIGSRYMGDWTGILGVGDYSNWRWLLFMDSAPSVYIHNGNSGGGQLSTIAVDWVMGDTVELLGIIFADGSVKLIKSINGAPEVASSVSSPQVMPSTFVTQTVYIGNDASVEQHAQAIAGCKIGPGVAMNTVVAARAA